MCSAFHHLFSEFALAIRQRYEKMYNNKVVLAIVFTV